MLKFKLALPSRLLLVSYWASNFQWYPCISPLFSAQKRAYTSTPNPNPSCKNFVLVDYLTDSLKLPRSKAIAVSSRYPSIYSLEKPEAVVRFFKGLGLSDTQIQLSIRRQPSILFLNVEKVLRPKVELCQELGLDGPRLAMIISNNPRLLESSLDKTLKPSLGVIREVLELDASENNISDLMSRILSGHLCAIGKDSTLRSNITYMRSCGVVGPQLIMLLKTVPRLFTLSETQIKLLVSQATEIGFTMGSRMLAYGLRVLYGNSAKTINRKFELLQSFGFTRNECNEALLKMPVLFETSDAKLRRGIEFFLHTVMLDKSKLVRKPHILMFSMEKRVIPRHKILETIKSRSLLKEEPNFIIALQLSDKKFVEKYISRFADDAEVLQVAYENHYLESLDG